MASKSNQSAPAKSGPGQGTGTSGYKVHKPASLGRQGNVSPNSSSRSKQGK